MRLIRNLTKKITERKKYNKERKLNNISPTYKIKEYSLEYGKSIKKFNESINYSVKGKKTSVPASKYKIGPEFSRIKNFDSRELLVRSCYNLFTDKKKAIESLNLITDFLKKQRPKDKPEYTKEFAKMLHQVNFQKNNQKIEMIDNNFVKDLVNIFNEKKVSEGYNPRLSFVHSIASDFISFARQRKYLKFKKKQKPRLAVKSTYGARKPSA